MSPLATKLCPALAENFAVKDAAARGLDLHVLDVDVVAGLQHDVAGLGDARRPRRWCPTPVISVIAWPERSRCCRHWRSCG